MFVLILMCWLSGLFSLMVVVWVDVFFRNMLFGMFVLRLIS